MINSQNMADVLFVLLQQDDIFEEIKKDFPEVLADLVSFKENSNCSCKGRIVKFFSDKVLVENNLLDKYVKDLDSFKKELEKLKDQRKQNIYSGKIITLPKTEEAWKEFSNEINKGKVFRGFSVVERENELVVYFL